MIATPEIVQTNAEMAAVIHLTRNMHRRLADEA
jgi:hypothetical protein